MPFSDNLKAAIANSNKFSSAKALAAALGVKQNTLSNWMTGRTEPPLDTAKEIAAALGVSLASLVGSDDSWFTPDGFKYPVANGMIQLPCIGLAPAGYWADPTDTDDFEFVDADMVVKRDQFCFRVERDSMFDYLYPGDLCVACKWERGGRAGHIALVQDDENRLTIKQYKVTNDGPVLIPYNSKYPIVKAQGRLLGYVMGYIRIDGDGTRQTKFNASGLVPRDRSIM